MKSINTSNAQQPTLILAIIAFALNLFGLPGIGSLVLKRWTAGIAQLLMLFAGVFLIYAGIIGGVFTMLKGGNAWILAPIGLLTILADYIWVVVQGVGTMRQAREAGFTVFAQGTEGDEGACKGQTAADPGPGKYATQGGAGQTAAEDVETSGHEAAAGAKAEETHDRG